MYFYIKKYFFTQYWPYQKLLSILIYETCHHRKKLFVVLIVLISVYVIYVYVYIGISLYVVHILETEINITYLFTYYIH